MILILANKKANPKICFYENDFWWCFKKYAEKKQVGF